MSFSLSFSSSQQSTSELEARTRDHYDQHPMDFMRAYDEETISSYQPKPFLEFVRLLPKGIRVADIGCGPGRALLYMERKGLRVVGIDISFNSLTLARKANASSVLLNGSNLSLPFKDGVLDAVVSDGVVHHTPDVRRSLKENGRVLKSGGLIYLTVYKRWRYYYYLYKYMGAIVRAAVRNSTGTAVIHIVFFVPYYVVHLIRSGGGWGWKGARNFFYDYFVTPRCSFHTRHEVVQWARECGLEVLEYDSKSGRNCHVFILKKA